ncbi:hypothetical protein BDR07DRAFT_1482394 [Suillus spraguei]|nr:hypothetical protein BDR07DRAFT_1482394 [Suillus spraguei]
MYRDWLYNRRSEKTRKKKASKLGQKWTSRMVIEQLCKEEIIKKTGARPGLKTFIERYQTTLTAVMASLSKEELEEAQNTVIEWPAKAPPAAVQADFAKKKAPGLMKHLASKLWKQASVVRKVTLTIKTPFSTSVSLMSAVATEGFPYSDKIAFSLR